MRTDLVIFWPKGCFLMTSGVKKIIAKIAKIINQRIPAVRMARKRFSDQKIERVRKTGKIKINKYGKWRRAVILEKCWTIRIAATISKITSQPSGKENSRFIDIVAPIEKSGRYEKKTTAGRAKSKNS